MNRPDRVYIKSKPLAEDSKNILEEIRSPINQDLRQIDDYIQTELDTKIPLIQAIGHHILQFGGKKLRPVTLVLSAKALGYRGSQHIILATMLEFIHVATLLHDDVVDQSNMRRGRPSANSIWGNQASVLVGDFLYSKAFELLVEIDSSLVFGVMAHATRRISEGEIMQLVQLEEAETTEQEYFSTIDRKTATLFRAGAKLGAIIADQPVEFQSYMANYGQKLGIAFQLVDDYLDYAGNSQTIGKTVGDDLTEGKLTLPLIYARDHCTKSERKLIDKALRNPGDCNIENICAIVASCGGLEYTAKLAQQYGNQAIDCLGFLPESYFKSLLIRLVEFCCSRKY